MYMYEKEVLRLGGLIAGDNVEELSKILNSIEILRNNFNNILSTSTDTFEWPLLHVAVQEESQKVVEYLLSQDFIDKSVCNFDENIYHVICRIRGAEELFSIIERNVPHHLLLNNSSFGINAFHYACEKNNIVIVKRVREILESLQFDLTPIKINLLEHAVKNDDIEVIKYVLSIDGIQLNDRELYRALGYSKFEVVVYLLNIYLCQSIPSHLHNQFHIFQFSDNHPNHNLSNNDTDEYLKLVEENYQKIIDSNISNNRIWHEVCFNANLDVVQLIFSLKGIQPEILDNNGYNSFLLVCCFNSNIKVIEYIHKLLPSFINTQINVNSSVINGAHFVFKNRHLKLSERLKILHYLYLNGIDIHFLLINKHLGNTSYHSIYSLTQYPRTINRKRAQYLKVISQDFDYLHNEHDDEAYRKPSFWKQFYNNNNNNNIADEQSLGINEWKNRFDEHVLHHLSKMIQEHMLKQN